LNILYFSYEFPPFHVGGLGTYSSEMTTRYIKMGHSVTVFSKNPGDAPTYEVWRGVEVHRPVLANIIDLLPIVMPGDVAKWPISSQEYFADVLMYNILSATKSTNLLVKKNGRSFDVIVAHDWLSAIGGIASKRELEKPFVFHFHSTEQGRTTNGSLTIKNLERAAGRIADVIVTVSEAMVKELISLGHDVSKIRVVPNGVDHEKYNPEREEFSEERVREFREKIGVGEDPMILFLGRLVWVKGVGSLVHAMPKILKEVPNAKLVIVGKGEQQSTVEYLIERDNLQRSVIPKFEFVSEEERLMYYAACDVAVFPSRYEPFGIVCAEAMSMGKPVVVGAKGISGLREQVIPSGPKRCGSHVDPDNPEDIAKFVVELLKDDNLRRKLGENARKRVLEEYTLDKAAKRTIEIYKKLCAEA